jgi:hypothetical protein
MQSKPCDSGGCRCCRSSVRDGREFVVILLVVVDVVAGLAAREEWIKSGNEGEEEESSVKERSGRPAVVRSEQPGRDQGGSEWCCGEANGRADVKEGRAA